MSKHLKRDSHLLRNASGHLIHTCDEGGVTCDINCATMASAYTVLGVGDLAACASCTGSGFPAWNGVLERVDDICQWMLSAAASIDGKLPSFALNIDAACDDPYSANGVGIWFNTELCQWELAITCQVDDQYLVIWAGTKSVELSPAGVYTRVCGCDETPTLTVA